MTVTKLIPTIKLNITGEKIMSIAVDFQGNITTNGEYKRTVNLGKASLNVVDHSFIYQKNHMINIEELKNSRQLLGNFMEFYDFIHCLNDGTNKVQGMIALLGKIEIFPEYRSRGLFKPFIWLILKALKEEIKANYVFLKPFPYGISGTKSEVVEAQNHLEKLYSKNGFSRFQTNHEIISENQYILHFMYLHLFSQTYSTFSF